MPVGAWSHTAFLTCSQPLRMDNDLRERARPQSRVLLSYSPGTGWRVSAEVPQSYLRADHKLTSDRRRCEALPPCSSFPGKGLPRHTESPETGFGSFCSLCSLFFFLPLDPPPDDLCLSLVASSLAPSLEPGGRQTLSKTNLALDRVYLLIHSVHALLYLEIPSSSGQRMSLWTNHQDSIK